MTGWGTQMEIVRAQGGGSPRGGLDQLVLYLDSADAVTRAGQPLRARGVDAEAVQHPYWAANGAASYRDPDGREIVFAPWVYGRDPQPSDAGHGEIRGS